MAIIFHSCKIFIVIKYNELFIMITAQFVIKMALGQYKSLLPCDMSLFSRVIGRLDVTVPELPGDDVDGLERHVALHHVEGDQVAAPAGHGKHPRVPNQLTASHGQLAEVWDLAGEVAEAVVRHVALAEVQRPEPGAAGGQGEDGGVSDRSTASGVEVA